MTQDEREAIAEQAGIPGHGHRLNGETPEELARDAQEWADELNDARAMFLKHEQERKLLDERQYQAVEAALKTAQDSPWLDADGCARYLGLSVKWVHAKTGPNTHGSEALPFSRVGPNGSKRFHRDKLDEWVAKHG